ncbi:hypothetical protein GCM10009332_05690 [Shewanella gelidii]|uniref:Uncharacterized protein n=1 Tax=Shewanella gelidii TaxID=1642821 RepID=A0A917JJF0_9GAMM|nr:hypothetical protein GCM10009332_05690 [Shewanella gelidii]
MSIIERDRASEDFHSKKCATLKRATIYTAQTLKGGDVEMEEKVNIRSAKRFNHTSIVPRFDYDV